MIDSGEVKTQTELAQKLGVSKVHVCRVLSLLKLDAELIKAIEKLGDPISTMIVTERMLREYLKHPEWHHEYIQKWICSCLK